MPTPNGPQFNPYNESHGPMSEMVPISVLKGMRGNELWKGEDHINELAESIKKEGLREPGMMAYYQEGRTAYLGDGHHRMAALERAGFTHMPVMVFRNEHADTSGKAKPVRGVDPGPHNYVPSMLKPSQIMDIEEN